MLLALEKLAEFKVGQQAALKRSDHLKSRKLKRPRPEDPNPVAAFTFRATYLDLVCKDENN